MTTDIEKQFFDTFGIEPKLNRPCEQLLQNKYCNENSGSRDTFFDPYPYCVGFENCAKDYKARVWVYPQITDRILLELICILLSNNSPYMFKLGDWNVEKLKDTVLTMCIKLPDFLEWEDTSEYFKHQVRTLFEEG